MKISTLSIIILSGLVLSLSIILYLQDAKHKLSYEFKVTTVTVYLKMYRLEDKKIVQIKRTIEITIDKNGILQGMASYPTNEELKDKGYYYIIK